MALKSQQPSDDHSRDKVVVQDAKSLPRRVLVAEDDEPRRRELKESLEEDPNVTVETVADGVELG